MPDDYYVSQYSGEEIDALLGGAGAGTVRYDAAQSLTDAQTKQARDNIAAAPDGFGLGATSVVLTESDDLDNVTGNGWYSWGTPAPANAPTLIHFDGDPDYCAMLMINSSQIVVSGNQRNNMAMRTKNNRGWSPWEYVNPPMQLGVEYRTTERFLGKPVYVKAINFGAVAIGLNQVSFMSDVDRPIRCYAMLTNMNTTIPWIGTPGTDQSFCSINGANARIQSTAAFPAGAVVFVGYYYKTNE